MSISINIHGRVVGPDQPCFIIAEAGVNHGGDLQKAITMVDAAAGSGVDAVKFQTFRAEKLAIPDAPKANYQKRSTDPEESQFNMLKKLELTADMHHQLFAHCKKKNILFLSTPFDDASADFLEELGVAAFKIPSGEITNLPFLRHVAAKKKPMIVSTGMSTLEEVEAAVKTIQAEKNEQIVLLHCVSDYPAQAADVNLRAMHTMRDKFHVPVGYSDHTLGIEIALAAVALGATVIEKHFTLDKSWPGPDQRASLDLRELGELVRGARSIESALGHGRKVPVSSELDTARVARRSLVAAKTIPAGTVLTRDLIESKRPGTGLSPAFLESILGKKIKKTLSVNQFIRLEDLS